MSVTNNRWEDIANQTLLDKIEQNREEASRQIQALEKTWQQKLQDQTDAARAESLQQLQASSKQIKETSEREETRFKADHERKLELIRTLDAASIEVLLSQTGITDQAIQAISTQAVLSKLGKFPNITPEHISALAELLNPPKNRKTLGYAAYQSGHITLNGRSIRILAQDEVTLGRDDDPNFIPDIKLQHETSIASISRRHALIVLNAPVPCIQNKGKHGTELDGAPVLASQGLQLSKKSHIRIPHQNQKENQVLLQVLDVACHGIHLRNETEQPPAEYLLLRRNACPDSQASSLLARFSHQEDGLRFRQENGDYLPIKETGNYYIDGNMWTFSAAG